MAAKRAVHKLTVILLLVTFVTVALTVPTLVPHAAKAPLALHKLHVMPLLSPLAQAPPNVLRIR